MVDIFKGDLHVHYGQFYVEPSESFGVDLGVAFRGQNNGLCGAASPGTLFLLTGLHTGVVSLTISILETYPSLDLSWEEIVEASFKPCSEKVFLSEWSGIFVCEIPLLPMSYRVRYCARGMDLGKEVDTNSEEPLDFYSLTFWPADQVSDIAIKQTSQFAAYWHNWIKDLK